MPDYGLIEMQQGDPIEERFRENSERGPVIDQLVHCINSYREAAVSKDPKFDHIDISERQKVQIFLSSELQFLVLYQKNYVSVLS